MRFEQKSVWRSARVCAVLVASGLLLSGCGGGTSVEFEGKLFEAVGLAGQTEYKEPKVADRSPLLLPPSKEKGALPEPGTRQATVSPPPNWPVDPDIERERKLAEAKEKERRECENWAFENKKTSVEDFEKVQNPSTRCKGWLGNVFKNKDTYAAGSPDTVVDRSGIQPKPVPPAPPAPPAAN
ncbi:MAG: hypothetical protein VX871_00660 [Pseudomonadota bacterium]|nr:hypothetical protein [Pseudomonadota bacterium]